MAPRTALLVDGSWNPEDFCPSRVTHITDLVWLCWSAPDTRARLEMRLGVRCHDLLQVVGGLTTWEERSVAMVDAICSHGPRHQGLPWRHFLREPLYREASTVTATLAAVAFCRRLGFRDEAVTRCVRADFERYFRALAFGRPQPHQGEAPANDAPGLVTRALRRGRRIARSGDVRGQVLNLLEQLDPIYSARWLLNRWRPASRESGPPITLLSSYLNNSRNLRVFEAELPAPVHWIVTNRYARVGAGEGGIRNIGTRTFDPLWRFARGPAPGAVDDGLSEVEAAGFEPAEWTVVSAWLRHSPTWRYWCGAGRLSMPRLTACWEHYLDDHQPRLVMAAGLWGLDGWLAGLARRRGIPVIQVLHGLLDSPFYLRGPLEADALLVWGALWRELWPAADQARIHLLRPPGEEESPPRIPPRSETPQPAAPQPAAPQPAAPQPAAPQPAAPQPAAPQPAAPQLTFFSWPFDRLPFYNGHELLGGLVDLFHELMEEGGYGLTVRAHPLENLSDLASFWRRRRGHWPAGLRFSQSEDLEEILDTTDLAVMFRSTVLLRCCARGIPVVLPRWIDFSWADHLEGIGGLHLARDLEDLGRTVRAWLRRPPTIDRGSVRHLLADDEELEDLGTILGKLLAAPTDEG